MHSSGLRSTTLYTDQYIGQGSIRQSTLDIEWILLGRYGCIGVVSERMINVHMICTQKQIKDIGGMRV